MINYKILNLIKKQKKYINLFLDIEPKSKSAMKNKVDIQQIIISIMKNNNYKKIKENIAIEIDVFTAQNNIPNIEKYIKNILDILHKKEYLKIKQQSEHLPFDNDNKIKYLRAKYFFIDGPSQTSIRIRPFSSFISDIRFTRKISNHINEMQFFNNMHSKIYTEENFYRKIWGNEKYNEIRKIMLLDMQKEFSEKAYIVPQIIELAYPPKNISNHVNSSYINWTNLLIKMPIRINLPGIPLKNSSCKNYKKIYKELIINKLIDYRITNPIISALQAPIIISVLYQQPKHKNKNYKDLDNIMLEYISPAINKVFRPPASIIDINNIMNEKSIGYEIVELPSRFGDNANGLISISIKIDYFETSIMEENDKIIKKYLNENKYIDKHNLHSN